MKQNVHLIVFDSYFKTSNVIGLANIRENGALWLGINDEDNEAVFVYTSDGTDVICSKISREV